MREIGWGLTECVCVCVCEGGGGPGLCAALQRPLLSLLEFNSNDQPGRCVCVCVCVRWLFHPRQSL